MVAVRSNRAGEHNPTVIQPGQRPIGHAELADLLRDQITSGRLGPGAALPSDRYLQETYGIGRDTVRDAVNMLRNEGLVVRRQGQASRVRKPHRKQPVDMAGVVRVEGRMPSPDERDSLGIDVGVPVWVVVYGDGRTVALPQDRWFVPGPAAS